MSPLKSLLLWPCISLWMTACGTPPQKPSLPSYVDQGPPPFLFEHHGQFDPQRGFSGYEGYMLNGKGEVECSESAWTAVSGLRSTHAVQAVMHSKPDITIEAFYLGQGEAGEGDLYGIWLKQGLMAPLPKDNANTPPQKLVLQVLEPNSLEKLRHEWNHQAKRNRS